MEEGGLANFAWSPQKRCRMVFKRDAERALIRR